MKKQLTLIFPVILTLACLIAAGETTLALAGDVDVSGVQAAIIREDYASASEQANALLKAGLPRPQEQEVEYYLGLSTLRLGHYAQAMNLFEKLARQSLSQDLADKVAAAHIDSLYMQGYYEKALKEANQLIDRRGHSDMISLFYLKAARANLKLARWAKAGDILKKITVDYPDTFESQVARNLLEEQQYFTVQVGAFTDKARAERLSAELTQRKEYSFIVETRGIDNRKYYRVRVGRLTALKDAQALESKLSGFGYPALIYP